MKFKVFVSANQTELKEERFATKEVILNTPVIKNFFEPFLFEDLPAGGRDPVSTYLEEVKSSDIYVGILGNSYGTKNVDGVSASELEYDTFIENVNNGEVLIFVKGYNDDLRDFEIKKFFKKIETLSVYKRFNSVRDLREKLIESLESFLVSEGRITFEEFDERINPEIGYDAIDEKEVRVYLDKRAINLDRRIPDASVENILQ